jgi:hypothetical protein
MSIAEGTLPHFLPFELVIGALVGLAILAVWLINRGREESKKIPFSHELITLLVIAAAVVVVGIYRSEVLTHQPLLFIGAAAAVISAAVAMTNAFFMRRLRREMHEISDQFGQQMAGLGNLRFFSTKDDTMRELTLETRGAQEKLIATRFSPEDISVETEYWSAIKERAFDPSVLYVRIHCLAHADNSAINGVCRLIEELRGARRFELGIAMYNNSFEIIIADERACIFCFHDHSMTIRNGFKLDSAQPNSARVVANFDSTLRRMMEACHVMIDFEQFVQSAADVRALQEYLRDLHREYRAGRLPKPIHAADMEEYLRTEVFKLGADDGASSDRRVMNLPGSQPLK